MLLPHVLSFTPALGPQDRGRPLIHETFNKYSSVASKIFMNMPWETAAKGKWRLVLRKDEEQTEEQHGWRDEGKGGGADVWTFTFSPTQGTYMPLISDRPRKSSTGFNCPNWQLLFLR